MNDLEKLEDKDVPLLARAWIHNGEILGVTREGNLIVVAKIVGEQEDSLFNPIPEPTSKHRPHKKKEAPTVTRQGDTANNQEEGPDKKPS